MVASGGHVPLLPPLGSGTDKSASFVFSSLLNGSQFLKKKEIAARGGFFFFEEFSKKKKKNNFSISV